MKRVKQRVKQIIGCLFLTCAAVTGANATPAAESFGDYTIHINAFSSDTLQPNMAKAYNIIRSKNRGLLTISVVKKSNSSNGMPIKARVNAKATNLTGQLKNIEIREINDGGAVYYISEFNIADKEILDFTINVKPTDNNGPYTVTLRQQFFTQ
ncbi:MAG: DUF4426 domain-containing protein [Gammaproteobacteria bacterium]|nr:DUF4426 domain-containing protein [Gammaproteobacteria bacterium]